MKQQKIIKVVAFISIGLFFYVLYKLGPHNIWQIIKKISWYQLLILFFLRFLYWAFRTFLWSTILSQHQEKIPFHQLFAARLAGHAVGYLTPSAKIGGEAFRILMVKKVSRKIVIASVVIDKTIEFLVFALLFLFGVGAAVITISMPDSRKIFFIGLVILLILVAAGLVRQQKTGIFIWLLDLLQKIKLRFSFLEKNRDKIRDTDAKISDFYTSHKGFFFRISVLYLFHFMFWVTEIFITFIYVGMENITYWDCFLLVSLGIFAYTLPMIPASLGIYEITYISLFVLLGIDIDFGLAMILLRRTMGLLWAGLGMIPMLRKRTVQNRLL